MVRKGRILRNVLNTLMLMICCMISGCWENDLRTDVNIAISDLPPHSKAMLPDQEKISDLNLMIFDSRGTLEYRSFGQKGTHQVNLLKEEKYIFCACINFGYEILAESLEELMSLKYHLAYPDEYREGIPMGVMKEESISTDNQSIVLEPVRLMSKISIRIDRSRLTKDVDMKVRSIRIGNCPKWIKVFDDSGVESEDDCFQVGFSHEGDECMALNRENSIRLSESVSLFMLENIQGKFSDEDLAEDSEKVFTSYDVRNRKCSFVEVDLDYSSEDWSSNSLPLTYRFFLGEDRNSLDIRRNCHYRITICPEDDGLKGDGWRVDKSGLEYIGERSITQYPGDYIVGNIGDRIHIGCHLIPSHAPLDIGIEYLEADKEAGIYDYEIDSDGTGVTLTLTGPGRGLIYMEAGKPIYDAVMFVIEVNKPI